MRAKSSTKSMMKPLCCCSKNRKHGPGTGEIGLRSTHLKSNSGVGDSKNILLEPIQEDMASAAKLGTLDTDLAVV